MNISPTQIEIPQGADERVIKLVNDANDASALQLVYLRRELAQRGRMRHWAPSLTFATPGDVSIAYTTQFGEYVIDGRLCELWGAINFTPTFTTASGELRISDIPVAVSSTDSDYRAIGDFSYNNVTKAGYTNFVSFASAGLDYLTILASGSGVALAKLNAADITSGSAMVLRFHIRFRF